MAAMRQASAGPVVRASVELCVFVNSEIFFGTGFDSTNNTR